MIALARMPSDTLAMTAWTMASERLAQRRAALGLSRAAVARAADVSERQIVRYEEEMPASGPDLVILDKIATALRVRPEWVLYGVGVSDDTALPGDVMAAIEADGLRPPDDVEVALLRARAAASTGWTPRSFVAMLRQIRIGEVAAAQHFVDPDVPRRK